SQRRPGTNDLVISYKQSTSKPRDLEEMKGEKWTTDKQQINDYFQNSMQCTKCQRGLMDEQIRVEKATKNWLAMTTVTVDVEINCQVCHSYTLWNCCYW
ncbi:unnamed protein product, partial [Didymodactylos carnosus]